MENKKLLIHAVLNEFQKILKERYAECDEINKKNETTKTHPPKCGVIHYYDSYNKMGCAGNILSMWKVYTDKIEKIEDLNYNVKIGSTQKMFFNEAYFDFSLKEDLTKVVIEWAVGPRNARGFLYKVNENNNVFEFEKEKELWVS